jgi:hypothetical protein
VSGPIRVALQGAAYDFLKRVDEFSSLTRLARHRDLFQQRRGNLKSAKPVRPRSALASHSQGRGKNLDVAEPEMRGCPDRNRGRVKQWAITLEALT